MYRAHTQRRELGLQCIGVTVMMCRARRACTRLAVGISSRISTSRQAQRTANILNSLDEGQVQEPMGGLD